MLRKWNRILAFVLSFALLITTFGSDFATVRAYAEDLAQEETLEEAGVLFDADDAQDNEADSEDEDEPEEEDESEDEDEAEEGSGDNDPEDVDQDEDDSEEPEGGSTPPENNNNPEDQDPPVDENAPADGDPLDDTDMPSEDEIPVDGAVPEQTRGIVPEEVEEELPEENTITINYEVKGGGGKISRSSEDIKEDEDAKGSEAEDTEGYSFVNWTDEDGDPVADDGVRLFVPEGDLLVDGATYYANFEQSDFTVTFMVDDSVFDTRAFDKGEELTIPPQDPFRAGYYFRGWNYDGEIITADNASDIRVNKDMVLNAELEEIKIFEATVEYFYISPGGAEVGFDSQTIEVEKYDLPATIVSPSETQVEDDEQFPVYYPTETSIQITSDDISDIIGTRQEGSVTVGILRPKRVEYKPTEFSFYYVYMLKDLVGDGYTEVKREEAFGVKNTEVTPKVIDITGGEFESTSTYTVTEEGQELPVYYTRANYRLEFDSNGG